jgi:hypothetical protein
MASVVSFKNQDVGLRNPPKYVNQKTLAASTAESDTVPSGANMVIISATADIYVNCFDTATISGTDVTDGSASELNPSGYIFSSDANPTSISVISAGACKVTFAYYKV